MFPLHKSVQKGSCCCFIRLERRFSLFQAVHLCATTNLENATAVDWTFLIDLWWRVVVDIINFVVLNFECFCFVLPSPDDDDEGIEGDFDTKELDRILKVRALISYLGFTNTINFKLLKHS